MDALLLLVCAICVGFSYWLMARAAPYGPSPLEKVYGNWTFSDRYVAWIRDEDLRNSIELDVFLGLGVNKRR